MRRSQSRLRLFLLLFELRLDDHADDQICVVDQQQDQRQHDHEEEMRRLLQPAERAADACDLGRIDALDVAGIDRGRLDALRLRVALGVEGAHAAVALFDVDDAVSDEPARAADVADIGDDVAHFERGDGLVGRLFDDDQIARVEAVGVVALHTSRQDGHQPHRRVAEVGRRLVAGRQQDRDREADRDHDDDQLQRDDDGVDYLFLFFGKNALFLCLFHAIYIPPCWELSCGVRTASSTFANTLCSRPCSLRRTTRTDSRKARRSRRG